MYKTARLHLYLRERKLFHVCGLGVKSIISPVSQWKHLLGLTISPLSPFPLGLKLVDSRSVGRLLFYLHFLVLILDAQHKNDVDLKVHTAQSLETENKALIVIEDVFSSPAGPYESESSG